MREPFTQLYVHFVWATWDREPILTTRLQRAVYACIRAKCIALKCELLEIGGIEDHVHALVRKAPSISESELVQKTKGASSHLTTHEIAGGEGFKWQGGYGAFSVEKANIGRVMDYIRRQPEHHQQETTIPEYELPRT